MKRILLLVLLMPTLQHAENAQPKRKLTTRTKVQTMLGLGAAAVAGYMLYEWYMCHQEGEVLGRLDHKFLDKPKKDEIIKYLTSSLTAGIIGQYFSYKASPDGKVNRAKKEISTVSPHLLEVCKEAGDPIVFYKRINQFFFYSHFPLFTAFAQLDVYDQALIRAEKLLISASGNGQAAEECFKLLSELRANRKLLIDAMVTLKKHPEWAEQMNSRNLHAAARSECTREFCA